MASFTDAITQFNPYVAQLPVEAMVKVGMEKQQKYEQGIQKIQAQIDQVAGLDVLRDVDKNYLQSKLNDLGQNLQFYAASDFSDFQLVNSVGGMTKQISKDKFVQNAVSSTAWYRKQAQEMESAIKQGKSSQANIYDFNQQVNDYASSTDLNRSFSGRYTPYTDVKKKALDAIKLLHPKLQDYDVPFEIVDGKVNTKKIADAMQRYHIEGVDEGQIREAISSTLTPDDLNQLSIDAKYQFRGVTPDALVERAKTNYDSNKAEAIASISLLNDKKKVTTDPTELDTINKQLEYYTDLVGAGERPGILQDQLAQNIKDARENPDAVKTSIYKDGFMKELSNAFSWKNQTMQYVKNPIREQQNWVEEQKLRIQKENRERYEFGVTTGLRREEIDISRQKLAIDAEANALKNAEIYGVDSPWTTTGNPTDNVLKANEMYVDLSDGVSKSIDAGRQKLKTAGYNDTQINMMLNKQMDIPAKAMGTISDMLKQQSYLKSLNAKSDQLKAQAKTEVENSDEYKQKLANANTFANSINGGKAVTLYGKWDPATKSNPTKTITPKDIINNIKSGKAKFYMDAGQIIYDDGDIHVDMSRHGGGADIVGGAQMRNVFNKVLEYSKNGYFDIEKDASKKIDDVYKEKLAPLVTDFVPQIKALGSDKDGSPTAATLGKVSALITATIARGTNADAKYDAQKASKMIANKDSKDTRIFVQQSGDNFEIILKSESDPKNLQRIKVSKEEVLANFGPKYVNEHVQESTRLKLGNGNTNITGNIEGSILQKAFGNFPGIKKMNITADLDQDLSNPDVYVPTINIKKKDGRWQSFPISGADNLSRVGYDQGMTNLNALTDNILLKYLKTEYPNFDFSQLDIK